VNLSSAENVKPLLILAEMAVALIIILLVNVNLVLNVELADLMKDLPLAKEKEIHQIQENHIVEDDTEMIHKTRETDIQDHLIIPQIQEERIQERQKKRNIHQDTEDQPHIKTVFLSSLDMRIRLKAIKPTMREKEKKEQMIMPEAHHQEAAAIQREIPLQDLQEEELNMRSQRAIVLAQ